MNTEMLSLAASLTAEGEAFVVATVVRREAPSSAHLGDTAIITRDGRLRGFIGGSCTRSTVVTQALQVLAVNEARLISFRDEAPPRADDIVSVPMTCHSGGSVEIYLDPVFPAPRLLLLGSSPVNQALAGLGTAMGYAVHTLATGDTAAPDGAEATERTVTIEQLRALADRQEGIRLFTLVATMGESDEDMLEAALGARPDYVGVIASRRRMEEIRATLSRRGTSDADIEAIDGPAGLDIGATRPEEIAISILAKIVAGRRGAEESPPADPTQRDTAADPAGEAPATARKPEASSPTSAATPKAAAPRRPARPTPAHETAVDPVCGMSVLTDGYPPEAEHDGRTYYFCCGGCRDRFLEDPETHLGAAGIESSTWNGERA